MDQEKGPASNQFNEEVQDPTAKSTQNQQVPIYKWELNLWKDLPLGCKFIFMMSVLLSCISIFFNGYQQNLIFWGSKVLTQYQIQRLFFSYLLDGWEVLTVVNLATRLAFLGLLFCKEEKKLSTVHFIIDAFLQNLLLNIILTVFSSLFYNGLGVFPYTYLVLSVGFSPLAMIFILSQISRFTHHRIDFWFLPFLIPFKILPGLLLIYRLTQGLQYLWADLVACIFGYLQFMVFKKRFTRLPFSFYQSIEKVIPDFIKNQPNFIKISSVQINLKCQSFNSSNISNLSQVNAIGGVQIAEVSSSAQSESFQQKWKNYGETNEVIENSAKTENYLNQDSLQQSEQPIPENYQNPVAKEHDIPQNHSAFRLSDSKYHQQMDDEEIQSEPQDQKPQPLMY